MRRRCPKVLKCRGGRFGGNSIRNTDCGAGDTPASTFAFTMVEMLVVITIILVLAGLILATSGYVHNKGARSRAEAEIAAMSAALENYKADNGVYPAGKSIAVPPAGLPMYSVAATGTIDLDPRMKYDSSNKIYQDSCRYLYEQLSGDTTLDLVAENGSKTYFSFKENQLALIKDGTDKTIGLSHIKDPFGNSYGYSTAGQTGTPPGYNPTFDLWSTAGSTSIAGQTGWVKNW